MSFLTNVVKVLEALGIKNKVFNDKRYVNTTGDLMTGGLGIQPSVDSLTALVVNNKDANRVLTVDTVNNRVGISTTNPTAKLQINSIASYESATLGSELLSASNWTLGAGWSGDFATGFAHTSGTADLSNTLAGVIGNYYQIAYTVTGRTAGSFTITFGGESYAGRTATGKFGPRATTTGNLIITPTTDFNGTIVVSIKQITANYGATFALNDSTGATSFEIRNSLASLANTFIGVNSGIKNTTGSSNSAQGTQSLYSNTTGSSNSAQGTQSLYSNTTGFYNSAQGYASLYSNTTGNYNNAQGSNALYYNTTGLNNSAQGSNALYYNTTGLNNSAQGASALRSNTTGNNNSAQGYGALYYNTTGENNSAQGASALRSNTTGSYNSAQGVYALRSNTTGSNNSAIGSNSGRYYNGTTGNLTSASNSLFLGASASALANGSTNEIVIGYNAIGLGSNTIKLGNTSITNVASNGNFEALDIGDGFILKSPDGTRYRITVADGGALSAVAV